MAETSGDIANASAVSPGFGTRFSLLVVVTRKDGAPERSHAVASSERNIIRLMAVSMRFSILILLSCFQPPGDAEQRLFF
jgi:hypothetical protein